MTTIQNNPKLATGLVLLRVFIGWHFLYEGIVKVYNPDWTSFGYLASAQGPFKSVFGALTSEAVLPWVDTLNWLALVFVGITLILGVFEKAGAVAGMVLLALYYLAHPSFPGLEQLNAEGSYWLVNKNLIEMVACYVLFLQPTGGCFGLQRVLNASKTKTEKS
ncbi:DoxX family membrane protein [Robiginitalea sp. M366]|uniref:DoxX family membrane protein n=1 Tax=Robiginitalea aestuariiviva TaxID=3036903 RepID=UPI00240D0C4D|nr:DoxX family membrane protein [Robiginitalea aestuariiviva]MDG1572544.1 DoxX family membrane protein [Robiginitalea aestuariiviva]